MIRSLTTGKARYYTIVNSFSLPIWKNYRKTINIDNCISKRVSINEGGDMVGETRASGAPAPKIADYTKTNT